MESVTQDRIEDLNVTAATTLPSPRAVKAALPSSPTAAATVMAARRAIRDILYGHDRTRLLVVSGPCSVHDPKAALDYARRLHDVARDLEDVLVVVMRTYFEKPRTTVGWKGLINDPHLDGSCDVTTGLRMARELLLQINELGLAAAGEMLDPITPQYVADLLSWGAIGARTTESQTHREMASGLSMPVGFKNGTDGGLEVALNAMISARHPHTFLGINHDGTTAMIRTRGNPDRHVVLRGGAGRTNYGADDIARAAELLRDEGIARPVMVDCSHDNSGKDHTRQGEVWRNVVEQFATGQSALMGLLVESNLQAGKQTWSRDRPLAYGISITDACIGWDETEALLRETAGRLRAAGNGRG